MKKGIKHSILNQTIRDIIKKLEKMERRKFSTFCGILFVIFLFAGLVIGYGINAYRIYRLKRYQVKVEKEARERLTKKLEGYQFQLK